MSAQIAVLVGFARPIPDVPTFVTPVFADVDGNYLVQEVTETRVVSFVAVLPREEFVAIDFRLAVRAGDAAIFGFETPDHRLWIGTADSLAWALGKKPECPNFTQLPHTARAVQTFVAFARQSRGDGAPFGDFFELCKSTENGQFLLTRGFHLPAAKRYRYEHVGDGRGGIRIGVIGYGYWGPNLVRSFAETSGAAVAAVADLDAARLEMARRRFPGVRTTTNFQDLLADASIDAIAVATPVSTEWHLL